MRSAVVRMRFLPDATDIDKLLLIDFALVCAENSVSSPCTWVTLCVLMLLSLLVVGVTVGVMWVMKFR